MLITPPGLRTTVLWEELLSLSFLVAAGAMWFIFLELVVVKRICLYCNLVHLFGFSILILVLSSDPYWLQPVGSQSLALPLLIAGTGVLLLIGGQVLWHPRMHAIIPAAPAQDHGIDSMGYGSAKVCSAVNAELLRKQDPIADRSATSKSEVVGAREITLLNGQLILNLRDWPLLGSAEAANVIGLFLDYTCPTCREVHRRVSEVVRNDRSHIAVLVLPIPQHPDCNPDIKAIVPGHGYACQHARLAVAVWQARPEQYEEFDEYLFEEKDAPAIGLAMRYASELAGVTINPHKPDEAADAVVKRAIEINGLVPLKKIPSLLLPRASLAGKTRSTAELQAILKRELAP
jgi:hypothetical protein